MEGRSCCEIGDFGAASGSTPNANYATWHGQRHGDGGVTLTRGPVQKLFKSSCYTVTVLQSDDPPLWWLRSHRDASRFSHRFFTATTM